MKKTIMLASLLLIGAGCLGGATAELEVEVNDDIDTPSEERAVEESVDDNSASSEIILELPATQGDTTVDEMIVVDNDKQDNESVVKTFQISAKQWAFEPSVITVNKGDNVALLVTSIDVSHGLSLSEFGVSELLTPGNTTSVKFIADKKGSFSFFCNVSCGQGHGSMKGTLIVK